MLKIEFFHDVICSFCFPMSARIRKITAQFPEIEIEHKSFALAWEDADFVNMFGSRQNAKEEVMHHWEAANQNDDEHRFNIDGMKAQDFAFPTSKNGLLAAKAAGLIGDQSTYWEVFDKLQAGLFMRSMNIEDIAVIESLVKETSVDFEKWQAAFKSPETLAAVQKDFELANAYQLQSVPTLIINQKYLINGALPTDMLIQHLKEIAQKENTSLGLENIASSEACNLVDGKWQCD